MVWYPHFLKSFPQLVVIHRVKGFSIVNEAEVDVCLFFFWNSYFFYDPTNVGNLISCPFAFSKSSLYIWKFLVHKLLKSSLRDFKHDLASMWNECNCAVVWIFSGIALFLGLEWKLTFPSPVATAEFSKFAGIVSAAFSQHHLSRFEIAQLEFHHFH